MKVGLKILGGYTFLGGAEGVSNGCMFVRNLILARLLSKEDFGIAATLALVVSLFELTSKMSFGQQVIQSKSGDDPVFVESAHACQGLSGVLDGLLILVFSYPLAHWFGMEAHRSALMLMSIIPLSAGFRSLENYRLLRHMRFGPLVYTDTMPQVMITVAAWPLAAWLRDYRAILSLLLVKAIASLVISHVVAERPYRLRWEPKLLRENLSFSYPLILSGFLMFGVFQGDRMLVAGAYSLADLGAYAVASTIAMTPCFIIFRIFGTGTLPVMARVQNDPVRFNTYYRLYLQGLALCAALFVVTMVLTGETIVTFLFGAKYQDAAVVAVWLAVGQGCRMLRGAPATAAMARGDTVNTLVSNLWRISGLLLAVPVVFLKWDLCWVAITGGIGEMLALLASLMRLRWKHGILLRESLLPGSLVVLMALGAFLAREVFAFGSTLGQITLAGAAASFSIALFAILFPDFRQTSFSLLAEVKLKLKEAVKTVRLRVVTWRT